MIERLLAIYGAWRLLVGVWNFLTIDRSGMSGRYRHWSDGMNDP